MRDPFAQLQRMQYALVKIATYVKKGRHRFDKEEEIQISLIHYLQIISDAANITPLTFKEHHPELLWQQMSDFQNFLKHYYLDLDKDTLWHLVKHDLPTLKLQIDTELATREKTIEYGKSLQTPSEVRYITEGIEKFLQAKRSDILATASKYGAYNVRVFGSVARGEADTESDIDLLVEIEPGRTLFDLESLLLDLQFLLGKEVDVVTEKGLRGQVRERVLKEAVPL